MKIKFGIKSVILVVSAILLGAGLESNAQSLSFAREVSVNLSVWDPEYKFKKGLRKENFQVFEAGKVREITSFSRFSEPMSIGIIVDTTNSLMGSELPTSSRTISLLPPILAGFRTFLNNSSEEHEYFVTRIGKEIDQEPAMDDKELAVYLDHLVGAKPVAGGRPYDALTVAVDQLSKAKHAKKVLILASTVLDDPWGETSFDKVQKSLRRSGITFYFVKTAIPYPFSGRSSIGRANLFREAELVSDSGGMLIRTDSSLTITRAFEILAQSLQNQFELKFNPADASNKDKWNKIDVRLMVNKEEEKKSGRLSFTARRGYWN